MAWPAAARAQQVALSGVGFLSNDSGSALPHLAEPIQLNSDQTFYVDSVNGSDEADGKSSDSAWRTIAKVNAQVFSRNTTIRFKGGQSISGAIILNTVNAPYGYITLDSYGGKRATITSGSSAAVTAKNLPGIKVKNLICTGTGTTDGIRVENSLLGSVKLAGPTVMGCSLSGYGGNGILIVGEKASGFAGISIINNVVHDCTGSNTTGYICGIKIGGTYGARHVHHGALIEGNTVYNCNGVSGLSMWTGSGIVVAKTILALVQFNLVHHCGANNSFVHGGPCGIWCVDADRITIQYNEIHHISTSSLDGSGLDIDGGCTNCILQYNYSHDNKGCGILLCTYYDSKVGAWANNVVRFNITQNNGAGSRGGEPELHIHIADPRAPIYNLQIYNNTFYNNEATNIISGSGSSGYSLNGMLSATIANNILMIGPDMNEFTPSFIAMHLYARSSVAITGNCYASAGPRTGLFHWEATSYLTFSAWQTASGQEKISGGNVGITSDPLLRLRGCSQISNEQDPLGHPSLNGYQLQPGSRCLGGGVNLSSQYSITLPTTDYFGVANSGNNVGAGQMAEC